MIGSLLGLGSSLAGGGVGGGSGGIGSLGGQPGISTSGPAIAEGDTFNITNGGGSGIMAAFDQLSKREPLAAAAVVVAVVIAAAVLIKSIVGR